MTHRLFTAIRIKPNQEMNELLQYLEKFNSAKTVERKNLHVNLKFLGDTTEEELKKAKKALQRLEGFGEFKAKLTGTGAFPNKDFIKVIWIGVRSQRLEDLAEKTEQAYTEQGFKKRDKPYKPHITAARVKTKPDPKIKKAFEEYNKHYKDIQIKEAELIESELKKEGPNYKTIKKIKL